MTETIGVQQTECPKQSSGGRGEFGGQQCQKLLKDLTKEEWKCCPCSEQREYHLQHIKMVSALCPA